MRNPIKMLHPKQRVNADTVADNLIGWNVFQQALLRHQQSGSEQISRPLSGIGIDGVVAEMRLGILVVIQMIQFMRNGEMLSSPS